MQQSTEQREGVYSLVGSLGLISTTELGEGMFPLERDGKGGSRLLERFPLHWGMMCLK